MSTAPTSLSDTLPSSIPKLDASGMNWAIFTVRFRDAIDKGRNCLYMKLCNLILLSMILQLE